MSCQAKNELYQTANAETNFYKAEIRSRVKIPIKVLITILFWCLTSFGCSNNSLSVEEEKWKCQMEDSIPICHVEFKIVNSSQLPISGNVVIRAIRRTGSSSGTKQKVLAEKKLLMVIEPREIKEFQEILEDVRRVTQITVSAYSEEN